MVKKIYKKLYLKWIKEYASTTQYNKYVKRIGVKYGKNCEFHKDVLWGSEPYLISLGNNVRITKGVKFITHDGGVWILRKKYNMDNIDLFGKITVHDNVHIGFDSIIMPGVTIGENVIIAAGAVVTHDIPNNEIWGGVPAKKIETIDEYYEKNKLRFFQTKNLASEEKKEFILNNISYI